MPVALPREESVPARPRLGFAGLGWIGGQRLRALAASGAAHAAAVCEPDAARLGAACAELAGAPAVCPSFEELIAQPLDGVVIATPNALHEPQAHAALARGLAVFCQKPLALSRVGTERLLALAQQQGVSLGVDWSYRWLAGMAELRRRIRDGAIGEVVAAELCFHNAYGPDAAWYYDVARSGGGCLLDLGSHLLDLCHWLLGLTRADGVHARCFRAGQRLEAPVETAEDCVLAAIEYSGGARVHLACSWRAAAGRGAVIGCRVLGTRGGAEIVNVDGSFYDFEVALTHGTERELLGAPPDAWPGRALVEWARTLPGRGEGGLAGLVETAGVIDRIYGRSARGARSCES